MNPFHWFADLREDAARYRWLRKQDWTKATVVVVQPNWVRLGTDCPTGDRLDLLVDRLRDAQGAK